MKKTFYGSLEFDGISFDDIKITITGKDLRDCQDKLGSMSFDELKGKIEIVEKHD